MGDYRLESEWHIDATVDRVWDILLDVGRWPTWWRGFRSADRLADGEPSGRGMRIRQGWRGWLPYTLVIDLEIADLARHRLVQGRASGDMAGICTWTLEPDDDRTVVRFVMDVRTEGLDGVMAGLGMTEGFDVGMEMSGNERAFNQMLESMNHGGKVAVLGIPPGDVLVEMNEVIFKGLTVKGIYGRRIFETWYKASSMLQSGLDVSAVVTHRFPVDEFEDAFEAVSSGECGKVVMEWA